MGLYEVLNDEGWKKLFKCRIDTIIAWDYRVIAASYVASRSTSGIYI